MNGYAFKYIGDGAAYMQVYLVIEFKSAARTEHYAKSCGYSLFAYAVFFGLLYCCKASYGVVNILVNGAFAAPRTSIYGGGAVGRNPYDGVVVVHKNASLDVLYPKVAMSALSSAACSKKHICAVVVCYNR